MSEEQQTAENKSEEKSPDNLVIPYMDLEEFIKLGFLQEANRLFFHPLGLALEIQIDEDEKYSLGGVWDFRADPEGMAFGMPIDPVKVFNVETERQKHIEARKANLGWEIQPVDDKPLEEVSSATDDSIEQQILEIIAEEDPVLASAINKE